MTPDEFGTTFDVPRGTIERLQHYEQLLIEWQARLNLVGKSTLPDLWQRHFADSAQLASLAPTGGTWLDMGAGGGFPGLVLAAMRVTPVHLVESVGKKVAFLRAVHAALEFDATVRIHHARVEDLPPLGVDVITARACAPLAQLFDWGLPHAKPHTLWVIPKGARHADEIAEARTRFAFTATLVPSITDAAARIIVANQVERIPR